VLGDDRAVLLKPRERRGLRAQELPHFFHLPPVFFGGPFGAPCAGSRPISRSLRRRSPRPLRR
jgi:hypothetical protein